MGSAITGDSRKKFDEFFRTLVVGGFTEFPKPKSCKISKVNSVMDAPLGRWGDAQQIILNFLLLCF